MQSFKNIPRSIIYGVFAVLVLAAGAGAGLALRQAIFSEPSAIKPVTVQITGRLLQHPAPQPLADIPFADDNGGVRKLSHWRGKIVIVNVWAMWCAPCKVEMPALDRLAGKLGSEHFAVLALNTDRAGLQAAQTFFAQSGFQHLTLVGDASAQVTRQLQTEGLPTSVILNEDGLEVARVLGQLDWDDPHIMEQIKALMKKP